MVQSDQKINVNTVTDPQEHAVDFAFGLDRDARRAHDGQGVTGGHHAPTFGESGEIADQAALEQQLRDAQDQLRAILAGVADAIYVLDAAGRLVFVNEAAVERTGYSSTEGMLDAGVESIGAKFDFFSEDGRHLGPDELPGRRVFRSRNLETATVRYRNRETGEESWTLIRARPILAADQTLRFSVIITTDITERKRSEEKLRTTLQERETLLAEIHHRVKNNLTIVASLLEVQAAVIEDPSVVAALRDSQNRIQAVARIHEALYRSQDFGSVNMREYIHDLVEQLRHAYDSHDVETHLDIGSIYLDSNQVLYCGLIIGELVTNAYKHAFPPDLSRAKTLYLGLHRLGDRCELIVRDNGRGLPVHLDPENSSSLGLQLINLLAAQMAASVDYESRPGGGVSVRIVAPSVH